MSPWSIIYGELLAETGAPRVEVLGRSVQMFQIPWDVFVGCGCASGMFGHGVLGGKRQQLVNFLVPESRLYHYSRHRLRLLRLTSTLRVALESIVV